MRKAITYRSGDGHIMTPWKLVLLCLVLLCPTVTLAADTPSPDADALLLLASSLDPTGTASKQIQASISNGWCKEANPDSDQLISYYCRDGAVVDVTAADTKRGANLQGTLPGYLPDGAFQQLAGFGISGQGVEGSLPDWLLTLPKLAVLRIQNTTLDGPLPDWDESAFADTAQDDMSQQNPVAGGGPLSKLSNIHISDNPQLSGPLPASWSGLSNLWYLNLSNNALTGNIPASWAYMSFWLLDLDLSSNMLQGSLAPTWSAAAASIARMSMTLGAINLSGNKGLTGCVPEVWRDKYKVVKKLDITNTGLRQCQVGAQTLRNQFNAPLTGWSTNCQVSGYKLQVRQLPQELTHDNRVQLYTISTPLYSDVRLRDPVPFGSLSSAANACASDPNCIMFTSDGFLIGAYRSPPNASALQQVVKIEKQKGWIGWQPMSYCSGKCCGTYVVNGLDLSIKDQYNASSEQPVMGIPEPAPPASTNNILLDQAAGLCNKAQQGFVVSNEQVLPGFNRSTIVSNQVALFNCPQMCKVSCCALIKDAARNGQDYAMFQEQQFEQCYKGSCGLCGFPQPMVPVFFISNIPSNALRNVWAVCAVQKDQCGSFKPPKKSSCTGGALIC